MTIPAIHRNLKKLKTMPGDTTKEENQLNESLFPSVYCISFRYLIKPSKKRGNGWFCPSLLCTGGTEQNLKSPGSSYSSMKRIYINVAITSHGGKCCLLWDLSQGCAFTRGKEKKGCNWAHFSPSGFNKYLVMHLKAAMRCVRLTFPTGWGAFPCSQINFQNFLINLSAARAPHSPNNLKWQLLNTFKVQVLLITPELCLSDLCASGNKAQHSIQAGLNQASKPFLKHVLKPLWSSKQTDLVWTIEHYFTLN